MAVILGKILQRDQSPIPNLSRTYPGLHISTIGSSWWQESLVRYDPVWALHRSVRTYVNNREHTWTSRIQLHILCYLVLCYSLVCSRSLLTWPWYERSKEVTKRILGSRSYGAMLWLQLKATATNLVSPPFLLKGWLEWERYWQLHQSLSILSSEYRRPK